jgi:hypothetical protein
MQLKKMKQLLSIIIFIHLFFIGYGQNGLQRGNYFLLIEDSLKISINSFEDNQIKKINTFSISEKEIFTTNKESKVAILDTAMNKIRLYDIKTQSRHLIEIPFIIKPKTILINYENLFIGGEMGKELLIQYNYKNKNWYQLEIPPEVMFSGKAVDDLVVNDSLLIAIDNIVVPKYVLFYNLKSKNKLELLSFKELQSNGAYESIHEGRITKKYFGLISETFSGYTGASEHITIYNNLNLNNSFSISTNQNDKNYHTFKDFVIVKEKIFIASKEKGFGSFKIKKSYFKKSYEYTNGRFYSRVKSSKIKYERFKKETVEDLTLIPNTDTIVLTLKNQEGKIRHELRK